MSEAFLLAAVLCVGIEVGARAARHNIKQGLLDENSSMPYLVAYSFLRKIADREPIIDDGDCGSSMCFYCFEAPLEETQHSKDCVYVEACKIVGKSEQ